MHPAEKLSLEGIRRFVEASEELRFEGKSREQVSRTWQRWPQE